jgi:hypothetical protein
MRETNDEAVHTIGIPENEGEWIMPHRSPILGAAGLLPLMTYVKKMEGRQFSSRIFGQPPQV